MISSQEGGVSRIGSRILYAASYGIDANAIPGVEGKPYTLTGARNAAVAGDTIKVLPGSITISTSLNLFKDGVAWDWDNVTVTKTSSGNLYDISNPTVDILVSGKLNFLSTVTGVKAFNGNTGDVKTYIEYSSIKTKASSIDLTAGIGTIITTGPSTTSTADVPVYLRDNHLHFGDVDGYTYGLSVLNSQKPCKLIGDILSRTEHSIYLKNAGGFTHEGNTSAPTGKNSVYFDFPTSGDDANAIPIYNYTDLQQTISAPTLSYSVKNEIDCGGASWPGLANFSGKLRGNQKKIKNLIIDNTVHNFIDTNSGVITDVAFDNITWPTQSAGFPGLIRFNSGGTVERCSLTNYSITSNNVFWGPIVFQNASNGIFRDCYDIGTIISTSAGNYSGGFVKLNQGIVDKCYSVVTFNTSGGGSYNNTLNRAFSNSGASVTNCYQDSTVSGRTDTLNTTGNAEATAKTTVQLRLQATFPEWDFDNIWALDPSNVINGGRPYLRSSNVFVSSNDLFYGFYPQGVKTNSNTSISGRIANFDGTIMGDISNDSSAIIQFNGTVSNMTGVFSAGETRFLDPIKYAGGGQAGTITQTGGKLSFDGGAYTEDDTYVSIECSGGEFEFKEVISGGGVVANDIVTLSDAAILKVNGRIANNSDNANSNCVRVDGGSGMTTLIYGFTSGGDGVFGGGTLYSFDITSNVVSIKHDFGFSGTNTLDTVLTEGVSGEFYGLSNNVIFKFKSSDNSYVAMTMLPSGTAIISPSERLTYATDGNFYATAHDGGANSKGVIYKYDTTTNLTSIVYDFGGAGDGEDPVSFLIQATNGKLYGTTSAGGTGGFGTLFSYDPNTTTYTKLHDFDDTNGSFPLAITQAADGKIYGVTNTGGANAVGIIYSYDIGATTFASLFDFTNLTTTVTGPSSVLVQAANGKLYGQGSGGGANGFGGIFSYNIGTDTFTKLHDFTASIGTDRDLVLGADDNVYGTTSNGGTGNDGIIFKTTTSSGAYSSVYEFTAATGDSPNTGLILAADNLFYGSTAAGGANADGSIFSFNPTGAVYVDLFDFTTISDGADPVGGLCVFSDGKLYGLTQSLGANARGVIFSYDPVTSTYTILRDFADATGRSAKGLLTQVGSKMYGLTQLGGANDLGVLFSFDPTGPTYTVLHTFGSGVDGSLAGTSLILATNGKLYGVTSIGGTGDFGTIFSYDPTTSTYAKLHDFDDTNGSSPGVQLMQASNGTLYGTTQTGGANSVGTIFSYTIAGVFTKLHDFDTTNGLNPDTGLTEVALKLYGVTNGGGTTNEGVLFEYDIVGTTFTKKFDFTTAAGIGINPETQLLLSSDGFLYGTTQSAATGGGGGIYTYDTVGDTVTLRQNGGGFAFSLVEIAGGGGIPFTGTIILNGAILYAKNAGAKSIITNTATNIKVYQAVANRSTSGSITNQISGTSITVDTDVE